MAPVRQSNNDEGWTTSRTRRHEFETLTRKAVARVYDR